MQLKNLTRRGDTMIEVMFAFAIFTMVAIVSVMIMNAGIAASERSLELVTARDELNAQAEALRFIHSSYIAEMNLPSCSTAAAGEKCRQYDNLWSAITSGARTTSSAPDTDPDRYSIPDPIDRCQEIYADPNNQGNLLKQNRAFIINTRKLYSDVATGASNAVISAYYDNDIFTEPTLGARLLYSKNSNFSDIDNSSTNLTDSMLVKYTNLVRAEGIWVVAVKGPGTIPKYYDFYVNTCWYGAGASAPTTLDTVVRLYNPKGV